MKLEKKREIEKMRKGYTRHPTALDPLRFRGHDHFNTAADFPIGSFLFLFSAMKKKKGQK